MLALLLLVGAAAVGYWIGTRRHDTLSVALSPGEPASGRPIPTWAVPWR
jgi:hypothetical protein